MIIFFNNVWTNLIIENLEKYDFSKMPPTSKLSYIPSSQLVAANYVKNSKSIGVLWAVFSVCYAIITVVVFIQPQWIGVQSPTNTGYLGPWKRCSVSSIVTEVSTTADFTCRGRLDDFGTMLNTASRASTILIGIATLLAILSVFALVLFLCAPTVVAYTIVSWMQMIAAFTTIISLLVFPLSWDAPEVKLTCGAEAHRYTLGQCGLRWAYILGIISGLDGVVLAVLGFVLGSRHVKLTDDAGPMKRKTLSSSGYLGYTTDTTVPTPSVMSYPSTTKRSMNLQPIVLLPPEMDGYSDFSKASLYRAEYATPSQQFQL